MQKPIIKEVMVEVPVAVATSCVADTGKPEKPAAMGEAIKPEEWAKLAPGAKGQAIRAQAWKRVNFADAYVAATSACK